jgi:hypothetical protein
MSNYSEDDYVTLLQAGGFESAIIGVVERIGNKPCLAYSYERCVDILMQQAEMDYEMAVEYMEFNVCGAYVGEQTPVFIREVPKKIWEEYNA